MELKENDLLFAKVKDNAIMPSKREEDAAYDIYACFEEDYYIKICPHETKLIPTGIASAFSSEYVVILKERGSSGTKGMAQRCGVIDSGFRGEWFIPITNTTEKPIYITDLEINDIVPPNSYNDIIVYPKSKAICQALLLPVPKMNVLEVSYEDLMSIKSERGIGALGSSKK